MNIPMNKVVDKTIGIPHMNKVVYHIGIHTGVYLWFAKYTHGQYMSILYNHGIYHVKIYHMVYRYIIP